MEMHVRARQIGKERQRLDQEKERSAVLSKTVKEARRTIRTLKRENEKLRNELNDTHELCTTLERQNLELEEGRSTPGNESIIVSLQKENEELKDKAESLSEQLLSRQRELKILQKRNRKLVTRLNKQYQNEVRLRKELERMITRFEALRSPYDSNPSVNLNQSRILIVGGLPKMESLYRQLIEESGGTFEYHDGKVNRGTKGLEQQVRRADLILCPIDHNSHGAAWVVKKLGKKYKKPIRMLANSGLSTVYQMVLGSDRDAHLWGEFKHRIGQ
jgi:FtsZ-binding cell division protein ZapB